jgi:Exportin-T
MDSVLSIDQDLVVEAIRTHAIQTLQLYASGTTIKWNDAELAIYLIFIFGEINKSVLALSCVTAIQVLTWVRFNEGSIRFQPSTSSP